MNGSEVETKVATITGVRRVIGGLATAAALGGATACLAAVYFARQVVVPKTFRKEDLPIRRVFRDADGSSLIDLPTSPQTTAPGRYSLWFAKGSGHACIGPITGMNAEAGTVSRVVERVDAGDLTTARAGIWSGYVFSKPDQLGLPYSEVEIPVEHGAAPAWKFAPTKITATSDIWAIHIHGMGGTRAGALRGVPVANRLGCTSLVVSFRNDREAPAAADARYMLGQTEWRDVEAAVRYAVGEGARQIVLFGWSLGGSIALRLDDLSAHSGYVSGLVLDAPVMDWTRTLISNARATGLPAPIASLGLGLMRTKTFRWVTGLAEPLDFQSSDWVGRASELNKPVLILHGMGDLSTPFEVSQLTAKLRPDLIHLVPFEVEGHSQEWNVDAEKWESAVADWLLGLGLGAVTTELDDVGELTSAVAEF
ncbi:alpha/beta fold hydrolase [Arthrobacter sp. Soil736]|uniref:alpha/beta hydrolase family protein n=1 Tax=Arthrobacter sp. Soil736 TaxID=1736395 RepID=UPI0009E96901|nr:alpha/beta fold hydrolase [Arthrobacter sp. Soil736]